MGACALRTQYEGFLGSFIKGVKLEGNEHFVRGLGLDNE